MNNSQATSIEQLDALLDFLDDHRELARGHLRNAEGRETSKRLWEEAAVMLNSLGGGIKTVKQWQKVWTDRKYAVKKIAGANKKSASATGGGPSNHVDLSPWEQRVLNIMGEGYGGPQTSACVPAFPETLDFDDDFMTYPIASQHSRPASQRSYQHPMTDQVSSQPRIIPQASSQISLITHRSSQPLLNLEVSSTSPSISDSSQNSLRSQASSQQHSIPQASSLISLVNHRSCHPPVNIQASAPSSSITQKSSQAVSCTQASTRPTFISQAPSKRTFSHHASSSSSSIFHVSSHPILPTQASEPTNHHASSPPPPATPQARNQRPTASETVTPQVRNQQATGPRTGTNRRRIISRRGAAAEDTVQNRLFAIDAKRLRLENKKHTFQVKR